MSHRDSRVGRHADARRDSGHDLERNTVARQVFGLLGPATENQGITPLEPDDQLSGLGVLEQDCIDLILVERAMPARLAGTDSNRVVTNQVQQPGACQMIVDHHIGAAHQLCSAQGQESRIAWPRAH